MQIISFFFISKLRNILTKKGQALEYIGSIQRKEKKKKQEMSRGTYTNHPKQRRLEKLKNAHKQAYNRVLPLINYLCPRSEGSYERMLQSSGRETIIIKDYPVSFLPDRPKKARKSCLQRISSFLSNGEGCLCQHQPFNQERTSPDHS